MSETTLAVATNALLFALVGCLAASVDLDAAISRGAAAYARPLALVALTQFALLPLAAFGALRVARVDDASGLILLVLSASPGGAYSNLWVSLFNADLALSVAATTFSTLFSAAALPLNLLIYVPVLYSGNLLAEIEWSDILATVGLVICAVAFGLFCSWALSRRSSWPDVHRGRINLAGNVAGLGLIVLTTVTAGSSERPLWGRPASWYCAVATPAIVALTAALALSSVPCLRITKPERVAIAVECIYQNIGIAASLSITLFSHDEEARARAAGVPLFYGALQVFLIFVFLLCAWKSGWTFAPASESACHILTQSYQPHGVQHDSGSVSVSHSSRLSEETVQLHSRKRPVSLDGVRGVNELACDGPVSSLSSSAASEPPIV